MTCFLLLMMILQTQQKSPQGDVRLPTVRDDLEAISDFAKMFFVKDITTATSTLDVSLRNPECFVELAAFLHTHPAKYAQLTSNLEMMRRTGKEANGDLYEEWTAYLHNKTVESEEFAIKSANAWKDGWAFSVKNVLPKLRTKDFPSTRRIAIEFLKLQNGGDDFGFEWQAQPDSEKNCLAIEQWESWFEQIQRTKR